MSQPSAQEFQGEQINSNNLSQQATFSQPQQPSTELSQQQQAHPQESSLSQQERVLSQQKDNVLSQTLSQHEDGYDPAKSTTTAEALHFWLSSPITGDLLQVPGIGTRNKEILESTGLRGEPICNSYELIGKFLSLKGPNVSSVEHCDRFYYWLKSKGITSHRSSIVQGIAERCDLMMPGVYDPQAYGVKMSSQH